MEFIRLKDLLKEVSDIPPEVKLTEPYAQHAYAKAASDAAGKPYIQANIDFGDASNSGINSKIVNVIKRFENSTTNPHGGYNKQAKKWFPHKSLEGGSGTIAYGHKIQNGEHFESGITEDDATRLLEKDINKKIDIAKQHIKNFDSLPMSVQIAAINALYRGDIGPKTMELLNNNNFSAAAVEYLNHKEYRTTNNRGIKKRMEWNASVFRSAGG